MRILQKIPVRPSIPRTPLQLAKMLIRRAGEKLDPMRVAALAYDMGRNSERASALNATPAELPLTSIGPSPIGQDNAERCGECGSLFGAWEPTVMNPGLDNEYKHATREERACECGNIDRRDARSWGEE